MGTYATKAMLTSTNSDHSKRRRTCTHETVHHRSSHILPRVRIRPRNENTPFDRNSCATRRFLYHTPHHTPSASYYFQPLKQRRRTGHKLLAKVKNWDGNNCAGEHFQHAEKLRGKSVRLSDWSPSIQSRSLIGDTLSHSLSLSYPAVVHSHLLAEKGKCLLLESVRWYVWWEHCSLV